MTDYEKLGAFYLGRGYDAAKDALAAEPLMYDSRDLTTHAVCVGMTGSGKTGLCISLLEEAALDGIPALVIDPKGDIANLMLTFPGLSPADFQPWIDPGRGGAQGTTAAELAAKTAEAWKNGLAEWGQDGERIRRFRESADVAIYTPGSNAGLPLSSCARSRRRPRAATRTRRASASRQRVGACSGSSASPRTRSRAASTSCFRAIVDAAWSRGHALDLAGLIGASRSRRSTRSACSTSRPFIRRRSGSSSRWRSTTCSPRPASARGSRASRSTSSACCSRPRASRASPIISIAHLTDAERMFVVTLVANELVAWMRRQPGTAALRAILYMDEIFGYFPPTAMPPSKLPLLTLMKQARAFGLGVVLATQNPSTSTTRVSSNAGTWFIGRLQTERDRERVIDGLLSSAGWRRLRARRAREADGRHRAARLPDAQRQRRRTRAVPDALGALLVARSADAPRDHAAHGRTQGRRSR